VPERVFLTGALGFIARAVADRYRAEGAEIRGVDRVADPERGVVAGDVSGPGSWQDHAAGCDLVVHTAALLSLAGDPDEFWGVNVGGTRHALDAAARAGAERFVQFSSVLAFSPVFPDGVDERHPVRPNGMPYVDTKVASEQVVLQAHAAGEVPVTIVRPADVYGPGSRPWIVMPVEQIRAGILTAVPRGVFSPVYIDDLVEGVVRAAAADAGRVYVLGGPGGVPNETYFGHLFRMLGRRGPRVLPAPFLRAAAAGVGRALHLAGRDMEVNAGVIRYLSRTGTYSIAKAREELGYEPAVPLEEGMARCEAWLRAQGMLGA
jgi:nucleoside-diphosphate-sugar epimerase